MKRIGAFELTLGAMTMKTSLSVILLSGLAISNVSAQHIHAVTPDTKGNTIELIIANSSVSRSLENVQVSIVRHSLHLAFTATEQLIKTIPPAQDVPAVFTFDVSRASPVNTQDTLEIRISDGSGTTWTKSIILSYIGPQVYSLDQNYPSPFNPTTIIQYQIPLDGFVTLKVYDLLGREVATLVNEEQKTDYYKVRFDGNNLASGVYFYRIQAGTFSDTKRFVLLK